jgi:hypothetical protein
VRIRFVLPVAVGLAPVVRESLPADAGPGEIYPSYVNVPKPGCWQLSLRWAGHSDQLTLRYS